MIHSIFDAVHVAHCILIVVHAEPHKKCNEALWDKSTLDCVLQVSKTIVSSHAVSPQLEMRLVAEMT